jgi:hypothetical protein
VGRGFAPAHEFTLRNGNADHLVVAAIHGVTANFDFEFGKRTIVNLVSAGLGVAIVPAGPREWQRAAFDSCGITNGSGKLTDEWRALFEHYPDRFLLGSDTWINERWQSYGDIMAGYRTWLAQLPLKIAAQTAHGNARAMFGSER